MTTRVYTFLVPFTFEMQFSFPSDDVELVPFPDKGLPEFSPVKSAIEGLRNEIRDYLREHYAVENVEINNQLVTLLGSD